MLLVVELVFLVVGLWAVIAGKVPVGIFRLLFGKGEYPMTPGSARLFGVLLASPLPASLAVISMLSVVAPQHVAYGTGFEILYTIGVIVAAIVVARRTRRPEAKPLDQPVPASAMSEPQSRSYGSRLLIIAGLAVLSCITAVSFGTLVMLLISFAIYGGTLTGNFMDDTFPWIMLVAVTGLGTFGIVSLLRKLRKRAA